MSILYTTHYMAEAQRLCHRVGIIDRGKLIALDTPKRLIESLGGGIIQLGLAIADERVRAGIEMLPAIRGRCLALPAYVGGWRLQFAGYHPGSPWDFLDDSRL